MSLNPKCRFPTRYSQSIQFIRALTVHIKGTLRSHDAYLMCAGELLYILFPLLRRGLAVKWLRFTSWIFIVCRGANKRWWWYWLEMELALSCSTSVLLLYAAALICPGLYTLCYVSLSVRPVRLSQLAYDHHHHHLHSGAALYYFI